MENIQGGKVDKRLSKIKVMGFIEQLKEKYPSIADIQAIDSSKYTCDQIALLFARQFIKRLKAY